MQQHQPVLSNTFEQVGVIQFSYDLGTFLTTWKKKFKSGNVLALVWMIIVGIWVAWMIMVGQKKVPDEADTFSVKLHFDYLKAKLYS